MKHPNPEIEAILAELASSKLAAIDLSLDRVAALLSALGNPQDKLPPVVHVAGTNGKGSFLAYMTAILESAGYKVHRLTSPYLIKFNEQIYLAGKEIDDEYLLSLLKRVKSQTEKYPVTFFEASTAAAFLAFSEIKADIVLLETGLGGRLDATNTVHSPVATVITPISMDHMEFLGNSIEKIAYEKAGIIKNNTQCIIGKQDVEVNKIIEYTANELHTKLYRYNREWKVEEAQNGFHFKSAKREYFFPFPNLAGHHQMLNAATAIATIDCLEAFKVSNKDIVHGITNAMWPARLQRIDKGRLVDLIPQNSELWLDGGHNAAAGEILAEWINSQKKPVHLICGILQNKDAKNFILPLAVHSRSLTAIPIEGKRESWVPRELSSLSGALGLENSTASDIYEAIESIVNKEKNDFIILICGSLYLAGNILWQNSKIG